jgi:hypothetical protein
VPQSTGSFTNLPAGTYNVRVVDSRGCTAVSTVTIADNGNDAFEINNRQTSARDLVLNATAISARIAPTNADVDWFRFSTTATSGQLYTLSLTHPTITFLFDLYDSRGRIIAPSSSTATTKAYNNLLASTVYSIQVRGSVASFVCYSLSISNGSALTRSIQPAIEESSKVTPTIEALKATAYPNPHQGQVNLQVEAPKASLAVIEVIASNGQKLFTQSVMLQQGSNNIRLNNLKPGMLLYTITTSEGRVVGKLVGQ